MTTSTVYTRRPKNGEAAYNFEVGGCLWLTRLCVHLSGGGSGLGPATEYYGACPVMWVSINHPVFDAE